MNTKGSDPDDHQRVPTQLDRIEWMLHQLLDSRRAEASATQEKQGAAEYSKPGPRATPPVSEGLPVMTPKQHVVAQLVMHAWGNSKIAELLGVTDNTAKVHVRTIAKKMGVHRRTEIAVRMTEGMREVDADKYKLLSGGLPKDWHEEANAAGPEWWKEDPCASLYRDMGEGEDDEPD